MKTKVNLMAVAVIAIAGLMIASCGKKVDLTLHLKQGETFNQVLTTNQTLNQTIQGQQQGMNQTVTMGYTFDIDTVNTDGSATITVTYRSVAMDQQSPAGSISYDSENPPDTIPAGAEALAALVGQSFQLLLSPSSEILDIQGADRMIANMMDALGMPNDSTTAAIREGLDKQFGTNAIKASMFTILGVYPERPVAVGDTWTKTGAVMAGLPLLERITYKLKNMEDSSALVEVNATLEPDPEAPPLMMGPVEIKYDVSGTQTGTMQIDPTTGWVTQAAMTQDASGNMNIEPSPQVPQGMSWPVTIHTEISLAEFPLGTETSGGADSTMADSSSMEH